MYVCMYIYMHTDVLPYSCVHSFVYAFMPLPASKKQKPAQHVCIYIYVYVDMIHREYHICLNRPKTPNPKPSTPNPNTQGP